METTERPVGFFLSGGLDSSLIASIASDLSDTPIKTFSIGFEGQDSPDLKAARVVANYIQSDHTEITFSLQEGLDAIKDVIWHLETFDTTTIRASVPMFLLSKYISENTDIKVVLSGEGADELFGGYLYFHNAPNVTKFALETNRLVLDVHLFDVLRADRCTAAHGIELRVPFFDPDFIEYVMDGFQPSLKRTKLEKMILRQAFDGFLPNEILYRQKNGMSDAVGYGWVDGIKEYCKSRWFQRTEEKYYKKIFNSHFGTFMENLTPYMWLPKWSGNITDPSARQLSVFSS
jgi:asparagine synthase (glutamine-hydrolysing)